MPEIIEHSFTGALFILLYSSFSALRPINLFRVVVLDKIVLYGRKTLLQDKFGFLIELKRQYHPLQTHLESDIDYSVYNFKLVTSQPLNLGSSLLMV